MPELPEVEFGRKLAERVAVGRTIERVKCEEDRKVYQGVTPRTVARSLRGRRIVAAHRRGKYIWFELDERPWPVFHFGMTGAFRIPTQKPLQLESSSTVFDSSWPPKFAKIRLYLSDGQELVMTNARRLGRISLLEDPENEPPISDLGFDPLLDMPSIAEFRARLARRKGVIKGLLLDQSFAAGVGNWMADEILFQAGVNPKRTVGTLAEAETKRLHRVIRSVSRAAVKVDAQKKRFPKDWLFHVRWEKGKKVLTAAGDPVRFDTVAGRTTAWVPKRQR